MAVIPSDNLELMEHFRMPRNAGVFSPDTAQVVEGCAGAARQGREIRIQLQIGKDDRIVACRYRVYGCPATIALCSLASEVLPGLTLDQAAEWRGMALAERLELPADKRGAVLLLEDAVRTAVRGYNMSTQPLPAATDTGRS